MDSKKENIKLFHNKDVILKNIRKIKIKRLAIVSVLIILIIIDILTSVSVIHSKNGIVVAILSILTYIVLFTIVILDNIKEKQLKKELITEEELRTGE